MRAWPTPREHRKSCPAFHPPRAMRAHSLSERPLLTPLSLRTSGPNHSAVARNDDYRAGMPPILQMSFHASADTGCTDRREYLTSAMSFSFGSALTAASVTGLGSDSIAAVVTATHGSPFAAVGSG